MAMGVAGRKSRRRGRAPMAEINVTPLVDVMLVLLIIFMVTAPLLNSGVPVDLPDSNALPLAHEQREINLTMTASGEIFIDKDPVQPGTLARQLAAIGRDASGKPPLILLRADRALTHGEVMEVLGELNRAGFNAVTFVSEPEGSSAPVTGSSVSGP